MEKKMRGLKSALFAVALGLGAAPSYAADPLVDATVVAVPEVVTLSRPDATPPASYYAAYEVKIVNNSTNVLNNVRFVAYTVVAGSNAFAPFVTDALSPNCVAVAAPAGAPANASAIECVLGQLRGGGGTTATSSFTVIFKSPSAGSAINLNWQAFYAEGTNDNPGAGHGDGSDLGVATTPLGTPEATKIKTYVPTGGGTFFTGVDGIPRPGDLWTSKVTVPSVAKAEVQESINVASCGSDLLICVATSLRIPGTFASLEIVLRRDATTFKTGAKIANASLYYQPEVFNTTTLAWETVGSPVPIVPCIGLDGVTVPTGQKRCEVKSLRREYTRKFVNDNSLPPDLIGDWEFHLRALENGKVSW
jgi:hypothetical protein